MKKLEAIGVLVSRADIAQSSDLEWDGDAVAKENFLEALDAIAELLAPRDRPPFGYRSMHGFEETPIKEA